jgi:AcrR family transcriptional regulator
VAPVWHLVPNNAICAVSGVWRRVRYTVPMPVAIGERKRRAIRGELSEVALRLLTDRDFDSLTIDQIADAAGISRRTFFRYFTSKEDVVFAFLDQWAVRLAADIVARPANEDPVAAVQNSFRQLTAAYDDRALALVRLVGETPSLREQEQINREHLRLAVVNALATRLGLDAENDMRPQILATIAFAPLDAAMFAWFGSRSNEEVGHLLDEALATFVRERDAMCAGLRLTTKRRSRSATGL